MAAVLVVQTALASDLRIDAIAPDFMLLFAICGGIVAGPEAGAGIGFFAGLLADLSLSSTPIGLTAFSWCLVGWAVGSLRSWVMPDSRLLQPVVAAAATVAGLLVFLAVGDIVGHHELVAPGRAWLVRLVVIESAWNALLVVPASAAVGWLARGSAGADRLARRNTLAVG